MPTWAASCAANEQLRNVSRMWRRGNSSYRPLLALRPYAGQSHRVRRSACCDHYEATTSVWHRFFNANDHVRCGTTGCAAACARLGNHLVSSCHACICARRSFGCPPAGLLPRWVSPPPLVLDVQTAAQLVRQLSGSRICVADSWHAFALLAASQARRWLVGESGCHIDVTFL